MYERENWSVDSYWLFVYQEDLREKESEMNTLRKTVNEKDEESRKRQSMLDAKLQELEVLKNQVGS